MVANNTLCHPENGLATHFVAKGISGVCNHPQNKWIANGWLPLPSITYDPFKFPSTIT